MENKSNQRWKMLFSIFLVLLTMIPYYIACRHNNNWIFSGFLFGTEDGNSYIAKMLNGAAGDWFFKTPYTAETQKGLLAFLPYILLGKLSSGVEQHAQLLVLFQIFRVFSIFLFVFSTFDFIYYFIKDIKLTRIGVIFACLGGGLGWLSIFGLQNWWGNQIPLEFYSPESFGFLSIYGLPHLAFARAFLLWGILNYLKALKSTQPSPFLFRSGIFLFMIGFFQPLTTAIGIGLLFAYNGFLLINESLKEKNILKGMKGINQNLKYMVLVSLAPAIWVIYNFISFSTDPFLEIWQKQNIILSPPVRDYILAYILLLPLMIGGFHHILKLRKQELYLVLVWILCFPLLAYAPYNLQRRLPEGIWIAIIVVSLVFVSQQRKNKRLVIFLLGLSILPQLIILSAGTQLALDPKEPVFRPAEEVNAFLFLAENAQPGDIVLASYDSSNPLPAWAPVRTLTGHGPESVNLQLYEKAIKEFFSEETSQDVRINILGSNDVDFVFWGPNEKALGSWDPGTDENIVLIYDQGNYKIYSVK